MIKRRRSPSKEARFRAKVQEGLGCWEWQGWRQRKGYGVLISREWTGNTHRQRHEFAHRLAYEFAFGPIPSGLMVCHSCDNPGCVRPDHLYAGTTLDNNRDREERGRRTRFRGSYSGKAKLTEEQVVAIRVARQAGETGVSVAQRYGVAPSTIAAIMSGQNWGHL